MTVEATTTGRAQAPAWTGAREAWRAMVWIGRREIRNSLRQPAYFLPNLFVPLFFYFVMVGALDGFARAFGIDNYAAFQLPVAILFAVTGGGAGLNLVVDIESGYFDKLLLTPVNRLALLLGQMGADLARIVAQGLFVSAVALSTGLVFATGVAGAVVMVLLASIFGIAFSAVGFAIALKTGSPAATQSIWVLVFPLMFLTTAFAPEGSLQGWMLAVSRYNPLTYLLEGMRALSMGGGSGGDLFAALLAAVGLGFVTIPLALLAMRSRIR